MAAGKKNATRLGAAIVFVDEAGFLMAPLVRRSWAPRGQTPVLRQRGRSRRKVSVIAALVISPKRKRVRACFGLLPDANFDGESVLAFLRELRCNLRVPMVLVWDRLKAHIGEPVAGWIVRHRDSVRASLLPPYAPELNPVETLWAHAKTNAMANFAARDLDELMAQTHVSTLLIADDEALLRSFLKHGPLFLRLR